MTILSQLGQSIAAWVRSKSLFTHAILVSATGLACYIAEDPSLVKSLFASHPKLGGIIVLASVAWAKQSHSSSAAGAVANAKAILSQPNAPTAQQIESASSK
jgi:hypothetical protein